MCCPVRLLGDGQTYIPVLDSRAYPAFVSNVTKYTATRGAQSSVNVEEYFIVLFRTLRWSRATAKNAVVRRHVSNISSMSACATAGDGGSVTPPLNTSFQGFQRVVCMAARLINVAFVAMNKVHAPGMSPYSQGGTCVTAGVYTFLINAFAVLVHGTTEARVCGNLLR